MTPSQHIDYDALALEALRGVIKACLAQVARTGLLGDHHFYIAFNTLAAGVGMSKRLKEKYPLEMTIVLQHRFWDLAVEDERFEVKLTFDGIPERLVVPFKAVKVFYDPSVPYVLQFEDGDIAGQGDGKRSGPKRVLGVGRAGGDVRDPGVADSDSEAADSSRKDLEPGEPAERVDRRRNPRKPKSERPVAVRSDDEDSSASRDAANGERPANTDNPAIPQRWPSAAPAPTPSDKPTVVVVGNAADDASTDSESDKPSPDGGAKIFDLSKFRGKK